MAVKVQKVGHLIPSCHSCWTVVPVVGADEESRRRFLWSEQTRRVDSGSCGRSREEFSRGSGRRASAV
jgi:hypothetical protein